jgi:hypothetical protein
MWWIPLDNQVTRVHICARPRAQNIARFGEAKPKLSHIFACEGGVLAPQKAWPPLIPTTVTGSFDAAKIKYFNSLGSSLGAGWDPRFGG